MTDDNTCRPYQVDGETIRVRVGKPLDEAGQADPAQTTELAEAQRSAKFWQGQAERWEREHQNTVLPYTTKLEAERDAAVEMVKTCTGHPDRSDPQVPSHPELIQTARAERDRLQARLDAALDEVAKWWGTDKPGSRTLMAVNSILRGHVDALLTEQPLVQPLHWRTEDGGIAAVMCSHCNTLGGHDDDCPRRQPPMPFTTTDQASPEEKP